MKTSKFLFVILILAALISCQDDVENLEFSKTGTVIDYAGSNSCGIIIELDEGENILPVSYPDNFVFSHGQRVLVDYTLLPNAIPLCDRGLACSVKNIEELQCSPYVDLYFSNYDSLGRDPIYLHEVVLDGECLYLKLSYAGGCREHTIDLARMHPWCGTPPLPPPTFEIRHNANGDLCEAFLTQEFRFDLSPLKEEGATQFVLTSLLANGEVYNETFDLE